MDDEYDQNLDFTSPVDLLNMNAYFASMLTALQSRDAELAQALHGSLDAEDRERVQGILTLAASSA